MSKEPNDRFVDRTRPVCIVGFHVPPGRTHGRVSRWLPANHIVPKYASVPPLAWVTLSREESVELVKQIRLGSNQDSESRAISGTCAK